MPKLSMNYTSDVDANTPDPTWKSEIDYIISLCNTRGLTPIFATIPCTATRNHEGKNKYIKDSGYRYIDFAKAVHGETFVSGNDNWYPGYNYDGTHPTALGAQSLGTQCMVDFPEIMQY